jgi:hypothetical protein
LLMLNWAVCVLPGTGPAPLFQFDPVLKTPPVELVQGMLYGLADAASAAPAATPTINRARA